MQRHKAAWHDMGVTWFECSEPGCTYKAKQKQNLKRHRAARHNIDPVWFYCDVEGCCK